jgi:hypothetical protein
MKNDEARMTNDEGMTKPRKDGVAAHFLRGLNAAKHEVQKSFVVAFRHLVIRHSFGLRHSSFVIVRS